MRYSSLSQETRRTREDFNPGGESAARGPKLSAQSFSAQGLKPGQVSTNGMTVAEPLSTGNAMASLKDSRVGGLFAKGSVKDNWRADGGLAFSQARDTMGIAGQKDSTDFMQTQADVIRNAAADSKRKALTIPGEPGGSDPSSLSLLGKPLDTSTKFSGFAASSMDPLAPFAGQARKLENPALLDMDLGLGAQADMDGGDTREYSRKLDDHVFNGDMSHEDRVHVQKVMLRKFGAKGVMV